MQVFATSPDPKQCAMWLDDKRLNKMITESAQILCTVLAGDGVKNLPFKSTHEHHPITVWADSHDANLYWLMQHHLYLNEEWLFRGGNKHGSRLSAEVLSHIRSTKPPKTFQNSAKNTARELDFTWVDDTHQAYRFYLLARWLNDTHKPTWKKRGHPTWYESWPFDYPAEGMLLINRAQELIGKQKDGFIACPRCGNKLTFKSRREFHCTEQECLGYKQL